MAKKRRTTAFDKVNNFNIKNPIQNATGDGVFQMTQTSLDKYKSNLYTLIFTGVGERVMLPEFGTRLKYLLFENITEDILEKLKREIIEKTAFWIPEIEILKIEYPDIDDNIENNRINMKITFSLKVDPDIQDAIEVNLGV